MTTTLRVVTAGYPCPHLLCSCADCRALAKDIIRLRATSMPHAYNSRCGCQACINRDEPVLLEARRRQAQRNTQLEQAQPWMPRKPRQQLRNAA